MNKNPTDATVCRYLFTAKLLYMFRVSQHPSSGVLKTVPAAYGTGHTTCTATPLQRGLIGTCRVVLQWINICILLHLLDFYSHWIMMHGTTSLKSNWSLMLTERRRFGVFENGVPRDVRGPRKLGTWWNCTLRSFMMFTRQIFFWWSNIEKLNGQFM